mmetsp:Transcript_37656/g.102225  ORF Transcript_37656/g.102225 Transcript_37656/m.102225 type:complete len:240 (-) Transcript_37656:2431-3150(-)
MAALTVRPRLRKTDASSSEVVWPWVIAIRSRAFSFSSERTRILSEPCSIARTVSSRYAIFLGELTAVLMSSGLSPVSEPNWEKAFWVGFTEPSMTSPYRACSVSSSTNGCESCPMSKSLSRPFPMPSMDANARKMKVKVDGNRKTLASVRACRSGPICCLMFAAGLPSCTSLKVLMQKRPNFSTASLSAPLESTPICSRASTNVLADFPSARSSTNGPPSKSAMQRFRKPSRTSGYGGS